MCLLEEFTANDSPPCQLNKILDHWSCLALNQPKKYASFVQLWLQLMQVYTHILVYVTCVVQIQQKSNGCSYARNSKSHSSVPFSTKNQRTKKASEKKIPKSFSHVFLRFLPMNQFSGPDSMLRLQKEVRQQEQRLKVVHLGC